MLKTVTFAPIPIPRVNTAITVKPGDFSRSRAAWRRSWSMAVGRLRVAVCGLVFVGGGTPFSPEAMSVADLVSLVCCVGMVCDPAAKLIYPLVIHDVLY